MNTTLLMRLAAALNVLVHANAHQQHEARQHALCVLAEVDAIQSALPPYGPHTAVPWRLSIENPCRIVAGDFIVAECETGPYASHDFAGKNNARRIIASVGACEGISTSELEALNRRGIGRLQHANTIVRSIREQLGARVGDGVDTRVAGEVIASLAAEFDAFELATAPEQLQLQTLTEWGAS